MNWVHLADTMDLTANKITVFELEEKKNGNEEADGECRDSGF